MYDKDELKQKLLKIDGRGYKAYKDIQGIYSFDKGFSLNISHVQSDPFASPSKLCARVQQQCAKFPKELYLNKSRKIAIEDYLTRVFAHNINKYTSGNRGTGKSGMIAIDRCGQEILERTSMVINDDYVEARFVMGLPARGRRILGKQAIQMLIDEIPQIVEHSLYYENINKEEAMEWVLLAEDQDYIREKLDEKDLIAFIGNGSILPRESGISDRPLKAEKAVKFKSPDSFEVTFDTPNHGRVKGMGIPKGITLIVGGGYHGKSTLLNAIEKGCYNHIKNDGREFVISVSDSVKIRAEDGRRVEKVDISPFINNLPHGQDTACFSSEDASGSTSQAANIMEALEMGAKLLLMDEDTSATNFMIRDVRMQELVSKDKEPITPFIDKVRQLYKDCGVSTVMVIGGSGDYFDVADHVIMMDEYLPKDVTERAKEIAENHKTNRREEGGTKFGNIKLRIPLASGFNPYKGRKVKVKAKGLHTIMFGRENIDLQNIEQLVDVSQTCAIGDIILYALQKYINGRNTLREIVEKVDGDIERNGLEIISPFPKGHPGEYARPRKYEIAAAINRIRSLKIK